MVVPRFASGTHFQPRSCTPHPGQLPHVAVLVRQHCSVAMSPGPTWADEHRKAQLFFLAQLTHAAILRRETSPPKRAGHERVSLSTR